MILLQFLFVLRPWFTSTWYFDLNYSIFIIRTCLSLSLSGWVSTR